MHRRPGGAGVLGHAPSSARKRSAGGEHAAEGRGFQTERIGHAFAHDLASPHVGAGRELRVFAHRGLDALARDELREGKGRVGEREGLRARDGPRHVRNAVVEHAVLHGRTEDYLQAVVDAGFDCIEVSDNLLTIPLDQKFALIRSAKDKHINSLTT